MTSLLFIIDAIIILITQLAKRLFVEFYWKICYNCIEVIAMVKKIITLIIILTPSIYFGIQGKIAEMGIILIASLFSAIFLNFEELKNYVSVIKTKDMEIKFKDVIEKAYATIDQLNKTQYTLITVATEILYWHKFWGGCNVKTSLNMVNEMYKNATSTGATDIVNKPIKLAYERLISQSFGHISRNIQNQDDRKKIDDILDKIYVFKGGTNMVFDCKNIPSVTALVKMIETIQIEKSSKETALNNINTYKTVLNTYENIYGKIVTIEEINDIIN